MEKIKSQTTATKEIELTVENDQADDRNQLKLIVSGVAGTGKSFLIDCLKEKVRSLYRSNQIDPVAVMAPTGIAAFNIGGTTVHK